MGVQDGVGDARSPVSSLPQPDEDLVDPDALVALATACRDHAQVRFDYRRADGEHGTREVDPHQLVVAGRRWYLVAWDRDRGDWRTFRLDRLRTPHPTGRPFAPREVPGGAAALVARAIGATPGDQEATLVVGATASDLADVLRWIDHTPVEQRTGSTVIRVRGQDLGRLAMTVARIALVAPVTVVEPPPLAHLVGRLADHLRDPDPKDER